MSISKVTPVGRASFPNLSKPDQYNKYSLSMLFPKSDPKVMTFVKELKEAVNTEAVGVAGQAGLAAALANFTNFKDGDDVGAFKTYRAEYAGHYILNVSRKTEFGKVCTVNRDKQPIDPSEIYAGCNVLAYIDVFGYKYGSKKSVSVGVQHVMKTGENTPFASTGVKVDDAFSDLDLPAEGTGAAPPVATPPAATGTEPPQAAAPATAGTPVKDPFAGV
jgi:hypothetical protein